MADKVLNSSKRRSERIRRRKKTLFHKAFLLSKEDGIEIALIILQQGRYHTYNSRSGDTWPPSMVEIVGN